MAAALGRLQAAATAEPFAAIRARLAGLALAALFACACSPAAFDGLGSEQGSVTDGQASDAEAGSEPDAGEELDASDEPDASEDAEAGPDDAAADAAAKADAMCEDTARDPRNCGTCGYDCSAIFASVSCINARCSRRCDEQHADCNDDLASGAGGDGCETRVDNDTKHCGGCDMRCVASAYGFASCRARECYEYSLQVENVKPGTLHGSTTGGAPFNSQLCPPNEVLVGLSGVSGQGIAYSIRVHCARLAISRTSTGYALELVPSPPGAAVGGLIGPEPPPPYERLCPAGSIVTSVAGATWLWPGQTTPSIRQIALSCATPSLSAERQLRFAPAGAPVTIGDTSDASASPFWDPCGPGGAAVGFTGRNGAYIDSIATHCGELVIEEGPGQLSAPR